MNEAAKTLREALEAHPLAAKPWARITVTDRGGRPIAQFTCRADTQAAVDRQIERARQAWMNKPDRYFFVNRPTEY